MRETITDVPDEIWEQIISNLVEDRYLEPASRVSKSFFSITNRQKRALKIFNPTLHFLPNLLRRFPNLSQISLSECTADSNTVLLHLAPFQLPIETLNLSNDDRFPVEGIQGLTLATRMTVRSLILKSLSVLDDEDLEVIADSFPNLDELDLSEPKCEEGASAITDEGIALLASKLPGLRRIDLHGNFMISDKSVVSLSENCTELEEVVVKEGNFITQDAISFALQGSRNLKSIVLRGMDIVASEITASLSCASSLREIDFSYMTVSDCLLYSILKAKLPNLKKFTLYHCQGFNFPSLMSFLKFYPFLEYLALEGVYFLTDKQMINLAKFLENAKTLKLSYCEKLSNSTFLTLVKHCPKLESLDMERTNLGLYDDFAVTNTYNPQVRVLNLSSNKHLSNNFLETMSLSCPNVEVLDMTNCAAVTKKGVGAVMRNMRALRHIQISACMSMKDLVFSMQPHVKLENFEARGTPLDDESLISVAKHFPELKVLDVRSCSGITSRGVKEVADKCLKLKEVNLNRCRNITQDFVRWMVFSRPSIRKINVPLGTNLTEHEKKLVLKHGCYLTMDEN